MSMECDGVVDADSPQPAGAHKKNKGRSVRCYHAPAPAGRMNLTYLHRQIIKFQSLGWYCENSGELNLTYLDDRLYTE